MMSERITRKQVEALLERVNRAQGRPSTYWSDTEVDDQGRKKATEGMLVLDGMEQGWCLDVLHSDTSQSHYYPTGGGRVKLRELYNVLHFVLERTYHSSSA
jgi:hypothetical protein